jgi:hypothetical protein
VGSEALFAHHIVGCNQNITLPSIITIAHLYNLLRIPYNSHGQYAYGAYMTVTLLSAFFDNEQYIKEQTTEILKRVKQFNNKLYLEFGGKLLYDYHAARVLPGYDPNIKMRLLQQLKDQADILLCIYAGDIERKKDQGGLRHYL